MLNSQLVAPECFDSGTSFNAKDVRKAPVRFSFRNQNDSVYTPNANPFASINRTDEVLHDRESQRKSVDHTGRRETIH